MSVKTGDFPGGPVVGTPTHSVGAAGLVLSQDLVILLPCSLYCIHFPERPWPEGLGVCPLTAHFYLSPPTALALSSSHSAFLQFLTASVSTTPP